MDVRKYISEGGYLFFDGAMGTMLQRAGMQAGEVPEVWNFTHSSDLVDIHKAYIAAGADVITTNTFGANARKLAGSGYTPAEVISKAVSLAKEAGPKFVALDIGPTGAMLKPLGDFEFDAAYELFAEQVIAGVKAGADIIVIETMTDLLEMKAAVLAARENSGLPVFATMSFEENARTFLGVDAAAAALTLSGLGVDALGVNCSMGPSQLSATLKRICEYSSVPVMVQANAGLPEVVDGKTVYNLSPDNYAEAVAALVQEDFDRAAQGEYGNEPSNPKIRIIGGCCGTNPEYISAVKRIIGEKKFHPSGVVTGPKGSYVCSAREVVRFDNRIAVVGERLNPTGKKKISAALREQNYDFLISEAIREEECGAQILDVNAGLPDIDEKGVLTELIPQLQGASALPLQIDTTDAAALEAAVRHYSGKPIINSVNGKEESLQSVLPIAAKYGAVLICLTLDEKGIPSKADDRIDIARKIMERAAQYGIKKSELVIDGLVMTVSTNQKEARQTLETVRRAHDELGLATGLGVSNVSFGLPAREVLNATFLAAAFANGLNLPIIDPTKPRYMQTVYSYRVLNCQDEAASQYIAYATSPEVAAQLEAGSKKAVTAAVSGVSVSNGTADKNLTGSNTNLANEGIGAGTSASKVFEETDGLADEAVICREEIIKLIVAGNRGLVEEATRKALGVSDTMTVINKMFIPALDEVGALYEKGKIFLPQLMASAETAKKGFDVIKGTSVAAADEKRLKIVLATVKGDIHDIGKNIVKMLLENYGFNVIDLGRDVPPELIVKTVLEQNIRLVGLSALMTTTVKSMGEAIKALREAGADCKIMVGGAVLNESYAKQVGADYYAKDAAESARIATRIEKELLT